MNLAMQFELRVGWEEAFLGAERLFAETAKTLMWVQIRTRPRSVGEGVDVEGVAEERERAGEDERGEDEADGKGEDSGVEEEPAGAVEEEEAEVAPAVAPGAEVGRAGSGHVGG